jgi:hypothetical protein
MPSLKSPRVAWSIAVAALALWATSVPVSWGQAAVGHFFDDAPVDQPTDQTAPCLPIPAAIQTLTPILLTPAPNPAPAVAQAPAPNTSAQTGSFRLCGGDQQNTAHAIEQLIAGHGFSANLSSTGDGCADLSIRVSPQVSGGTASSQMNVSLGSGANLSIQIVSQSGATRVTIGQS